jgi:hypothetical protein
MGDAAQAPERERDALGELLLERTRWREAFEHLLKKGLPFLLGLEPLDDDGVEGPDAVRGGVLRDLTLASGGLRAALL